MKEVMFRFRVNSNDDHAAVEMACDYFCGGDFAGLVTQMEPEVMELRNDEEPQAGQT